ncbi:MAG: S-layer homology domain-containing protein [Clostridia bacterium]|nr:S-layer homology domain-containing protein [Clostridia bacterium]
MKNFKRILALVLAVMMVAACMVTTYAAEADDAVAYNEEAIVRLNKLGIFQGKSDGLEPEDDVTRAEMAQLTGRVMTGKVSSNYWENYENDTTFEDLDAAAWAVGAVSYAYEQGIVVGKSDVRFDPMGNVTYQDALTMVVRSLGYTGLSYPNGFINKAMKLGLTNGIANIAYGDAANRGVIATILYNALYAEESLFADNFNLTSGTYMLVATPTVVINKDCKLPGASINGYIGKELNEGYVAFAPIGADNKAVNQAAKYVYARVSQISDDLKGNQIDSNYADKLGYAYNLTFENDVLTWGDECATKTFKNYGDNREITISEIDYDHKFDAAGNVVWSQNYFLTFGGQAYNLVDGTKADYNAPTNTQDIILYADYGSEGLYVDDYAQIFNGDTIVDEDGTPLLTWIPNVGYCKTNIHGKVEKATAEDILAAIAHFENSVLSDYAAIEGGDDIVAIYKNNVLGTSTIIDAEKLADVKFNVAANIASNYFCEITAMDYDNDGLYDAAIYTPWYVGTVGTEVKDYDGDGEKEFFLTGVTTADGTEELLGKYYGYDKNGDGKVDKKDAKGNSELPHVDDYVVTGAATKLESYAPWLYKYNRNTHEINVIERASDVKGKVEWGVKGMVTPVSNIYEDSQVSIGGKVWQVGGWTYNNLLGLKNFHIMDSYRIDKIAGSMKDYYNLDDSVVITNEYQNGWNDVLDYGMTDDCASFVGFAIAGHLISGVPTLSASASYDFVAFNAYQSEFALENDQIVVDAIVDASGKYQTIKINSVDSMEFTELEFQIFTAYCDIFYDAVPEDKMNSVYSYYFNADRLATHQATPLYKAVERAFIIDRLTNNYTDADKDGYAENVWKNAEVTLVYAVNGKNDDGAYQLLTVKETTKGSAPNAAVVEFTYGISDAAIIKDKTPIRTDAETVFTFVAKDGIYTYVGTPKNGYKIDLTAAPSKAVYVANSDEIMIVDTTRDISQIAIGDTDWAEKVQEIVLNDSDRCAKFSRNHFDTWAFVEYIPYVSATFHADEVYLVTAKTSNTKIYFENGVSYYVYANLYNLVDAKYEEAVIFTGDEVAVFNANLADAEDTMYEGSKTDVATNYGLIITRDNETGVDTYLPAEYKDEANANVIFNLADDFGNLTDLKRGVYQGKLTDNTGAISHVMIDGEYKTVNKVEFIVAYKTAGTVEVGTFSNIAKNAVIFYEYNPVTAVLTGYAFN